LLPQNVVSESSSGRAHEEGLDHVPVVDVPAQREHRVPIDRWLSGHTHRVGGAGVDLTDGLTDLPSHRTVGAAGPASECRRQTPAAPGAPSRNSEPPADAASAQHPLEQIEKLGELKDRGFLSEAEFTAKKSELLARF
jgi:hypothetical protein